MLHLNVTSVYIKKLSLKHGYLGFLFLNNYNNCYFLKKNFNTYAIIYILIDKSLSEFYCISYFIVITSIKCLKKDIEINIVCLFANLFFG